MNCRPANSKLSFNEKYQDPRLTISPIGKIQAIKVSKNDMNVSVIQTRFFILLKKKEIQPIMIGNTIQMSGALTCHSPDWGKVTDMNQPMLSSSL